MDLSLSVTATTDCPLYVGLVLGVWDVGEQKRQKKSLCHGAYILGRDREENKQYTW